jgi:hypothetical protein
MTAKVRLCVAAIALWWAHAGAGAAGAATPLASVSVSPDSAVVLGSNQQPALANDVAVDNLDGTFGIAPLGTIPLESNVTGYDLLPNGDQLLCFDTTVVLPGSVVVQPGDVARAGLAYSIEFAAAANGVPTGAYCDAITRDGAGKLVLSFDISMVLPGSVTANDEDLVRLDAPSTWSLFFDGSSLGILAELDVDGVDQLENGNVAFSFDGSGQVFGPVDFDDEDVLEWDTDGMSWSVAYDGSAQDPDWATADVDAIALPEPALAWMLVGGIAGLTALMRAR